VVDEPVAGEVPAPAHMAPGAETIMPSAAVEPRRTGGAHRKTKPGKAPKQPQQPQPPKEPKPPREPKPPKAVKPPKPPRPSRGSKHGAPAPAPSSFDYPAAVPAPESPVSPESPESTALATGSPTHTTETTVTTETVEAVKAKNSVTPSKASRPFWIEAVVLLAIAAVIAVGVHSFLFQAFFIPTGSMENTLKVGDRVIVNRLSYKVGHVQRGQIVVFSGVDSWSPEGSVTTPHNPVLRQLSKVGSYLGFAPSGEQDFIKRVIGVPGDRVVCCDAQGRITVNGHPLVENYLYPGSNNRTLPFDITVPPGHLWVEGDHRNDSADSRSHTGLPGGGSIPVNKVIGRAFVIVWPFSRFHGLSTPSSFSTLSSATASALPSTVGLAAVLPIAFVRRRRRRRRNTGPRTT
jgi:signal peptidase I